MWSMPDRSEGLILDLYHLDSAFVSWRTGLNARATFDLYSRRHPFDGGYMLVAGLEQAVEFALGFEFSEDDLAYLRSLKRYPEDFLAELGRHRFTGEIFAIPEGTIAFADEPLVRVSAPFREALVIESGMLHSITLATLIATKAARVSGAAHGRPVSEFGLRRAQAPFVAVRSAAIGGCATTSFVAAAKEFRLTPTGTIPHALVQAYPTEEEAFLAVAQTLEPFTLLLDTYDVGRAIETAVAVAETAQRRWGHTLAAVRLDSGDLAGDARMCRKVLDAAGLIDVRIVASGDLDEFLIEDLLRAGAPIDAFGVGTAMGVGAGSVEHGVPGGSISTAYKCVWYEGTGDHAAIKRAGRKGTWPGRKQVWRCGDFDEDVIALEDEPPPAAGIPLLEQVVGDGALTGGLPSLEAIRGRANAQLASFPERYRALKDPTPYPVRRSDAVIALHDRALRTRGLL